MKVIAAYSHKGGAGKTTALMMLAQAIIAKGQNVLLVDCDPQINFQRWKEECDPNHWPEKSQVIYRNFALTTSSEIDETLLNANESGQYDYCLLNLPGVDDPFNAYVLRYAELTLIPFKPGATEFVELSPAIAAIKRLEADNVIGAVRVLFMQTNDMTAADRLYYSAAKEAFDHLLYEVPRTAILKNISMEGIFIKIIEQYADIVTGLDKNKIVRLRTALDDCTKLLSACDAVVEDVVHA